jgi:MFS family permease
MWMQGKDIDSATIGLVMLAAVLGGLAFQIPVGHISDRLDRRLVLAGLCVGLAGVALALVHLPRTLLVILPVVALFGSLYLRFTRFASLMPMISCRRIGSCP